jgi:hypothetical protein
MRGTILYQISLLLLKSAILLDWVAIFVPRNTRNAFYWISYAVLVVHGVFYLGMIIFEFASCTPFEKKFNPLIPGKCISNYPLLLARSVINLTFDLILFVLPQRVIWSLNMTTKQKVGISVVFGVGVM